jgi:hypothetical protein
MVIDVLWLIEIGIIFYFINRRAGQLISAYNKKDAHYVAKERHGGYTPQSDEKPKQTVSHRDIEQDPKMLLPAINKAATARGFGK